MRASDRAEFQSLLSDAMAFYRQDVSTFALSVWWAACESFDLEQVRKALTAHAMDPERGQFPPKPADLVRHLSGTNTDRALLAWSALHGAMNSVGAYSSVDFGDPAIHAVVTDMGGWQTLCRSAVDELPHIQRRFCEAYRAYIKRAGQFDAPRWLVGDSEVQNFAAGYEVPPPKLIGARTAPAREALARGGA